MSTKVYDGQGRWRNKTVAFHMSPEENELLNKAVALSGLIKQDYIIKRLQEHDIVVVGNPRVYKALRNQLSSVCDELRRIIHGEPIDADLLELMRLISITLNGLKEGEND